MKMDKRKVAARTTIGVQGARVHNMKHVSLEIPRNRLIVVTGLSGSGKSSLAFDTIYAEGQRRYLESLSSFAKRFIAQVAKPDVDFVFGLSPVISIEQKTTVNKPRSTVGTMTDIASYLNLLFATHPFHVLRAAEMRGWVESGARRDQHQDHRDESPPPSHAHRPSRAILRGRHPPAPAGEARSPDRDGRELVRPGDLGGCPPERRDDRRPRQAFQKHPEGIERRAAFHLRVRGEDVQARTERIGQGTGDVPDPPQELVDRRHGRRELRRLQHAGRHPRPERHPSPDVRRITVAELLLDHQRFRRGPPAGRGGPSPVPRA